MDNRDMLRPGMPYSGAMASTSGPNPAAAKSRQTATAPTQQSNGWTPDKDLDGGILSDESRG